MQLIAVLFIGVLATLTSTAAESETPFYTEYSSEEELNAYDVEPSDNSYEMEPDQFNTEAVKEAIKKQHVTLDMEKVQSILTNSELSDEERFAALAQLALEMFAEFDEKNGVKVENNAYAEIESNEVGKNENLQSGALPLFLNIITAEDIADESKPAIEKPDSESINKEDKNTEKTEEKNE